MISKELVAEARVKILKTPEQYFDGLEGTVVMVDTVRFPTHQNIWVRVDYEREPVAFSVNELRVVTP